MQKLSSISLFSKNGESHATVILEEPDVHDRPGTSEYEPGVEENVYVKSQDDDEGVQVNVLKSMSALVEQLPISKL